MEWKHGYGHTWIGHTLWSTGRSDRVASLDDDDDDDDDDDVILPFYPNRDTLVRSSRAYTRPLPRVTRVSAGTRGGGGG